MSSRQVIDFQCAKQSGEELQALLGASVEVNLEARSMHQPTGGEMEQVINWRDMVLQLNECLLGQVMEFMQAKLA